MDLPWGDQRTNTFVTNVGLITSKGPHGENIMAAEWTHMLSYSPGLIATCIGFNKATVDNIQAQKEFGINICAPELATMSSLSGGYAGKNYDKIGALKELGFTFYEGRKINVPMVENAAMNAECKLFKEITLGDHIMFVGEVQEATASGKESMAYHAGKYWVLKENVPVPSQEERDRIASIVEKHKK